jgi:hypothetical protein
MARQKTSGRGLNVGVAVDWLGMLTIIGSVMSLLMSGKSAIGALMIPVSLGGIISGLLLMSVAAALANLKRAADALDVNNDLLETLIQRMPQPPGKPNLVAERQRAEKALKEEKDKEARAKALAEIKRREAARKTAT